MEPSQGHILVVDDNEYNRDMISRWLGRQGHSFVIAENGRKALDILQNEQKIDLMLLDIMMPEMNGFEVLEHLKNSSRWHSLPVIVISAADDIENIIKCIELGAEDFLFKPFNRTLLKARLDTSLEKKYLRDREESYRKQIEEYNLHLERRVREQVKQITAAQQATITALATLAESRNPETGKHLERVREYTRAILQRLATNPRYLPDLPQQKIDNIIAASVLHDIGKVGIPDHILTKPDKLTAEEFDIMKTHTLIGATTLSEVYEMYPENGFLQIGIEIALNHHEKWDGSGYPNQRKGEEIPLSARILALVDVYDALTSRRCYKEAFSHEKSMEMILEGSGTHFDPLIVECFYKAQEDFSKIKDFLQEPGDFLLGGITTNENG